MSIVMKRKTYASNILRHLPLEAQRNALAKVPQPAETYEDVLKPRHLKAHSPEALKERAMLLRPTSRKGHEETIYVASLGVLGGWTAEDCLKALGAAGARNATVVALDSGRHIPPTATGAELAEAISEFVAARRRQQTTGGRVAAGAARKAGTAARAALIAEDWHRVDVPTDVLLQRAGRTLKRKTKLIPMAYRTAVQHLGRRPTARKLRAARQQMEKQNEQA